MTTTDVAKALGSGIIHQSGFVARTHRWSTQSWQQALRRDPCVFCGSQSESLDHIRPYAKMGRHGWENRAPACRQCNQEKGTLGLIEYLIHRRNGAMPPANERQERRFPLIPRQYQMRPLRTRIHEFMGLPYQAGVDNGPRS